MAKRIMLKPGDNPLEMEFTDHRPPYLRFFMLALALIAAGVCCSLPVLWAFGVIG